jgi:predicted transcriptional regulator
MFRGMSNLDLFRRDFILSIKPEYAARIVEGLKTVELRRRFPFGAATDARMFIYSSAPVQALIGYATILDVERLEIEEIWEKYSSVAFIERSDFDEYFRGRTKGFVIRLGQPVRLVTPIALSTLKAELGFTPPQSFTYADDGLNRLLRAS